MTDHIQPEPRAEPLEHDVEEVQRSPAKPRTRRFLPTRKQLIGLIAVVGLIALAVLVFYRPSASPPPKIENCIPTLRALVEQVEVESGDAAKAYVPDAPGEIADPAVPVAEILQRLPGVVQVDVCVPVDKPKSRIIQLRDWHFVPKDLYALALRPAGLSDAEVNIRHQELVLQADAVQLEQMAVLRCLVRHHGLHRAFCEGLTPKGLANYKETVKVLRNKEGEIKQTRNLLAEVRGSTQGLPPGSEAYARNQATEKGLIELLDQHRTRLVEIGAVGRLMVAGEIDDVLPLDSAELLDRALPVTPDGKVQINAERMQARHDAQVKAILGNGGVGVIVLGGAHDLSDSVRQLGQGQCEYIRVTTKRLRDFTAEKGK